MNAFASNIQITYKSVVDRRLKIFIAYTSPDRIAVSDFYTTLKNHEFEPWLDNENLYPGNEWEKEVKLAIEKCDIFMPCFTSKSSNRNGYFNEELKIAQNVAHQRGINEFIMPIKLEDCEIPIAYGKYHVVGIHKADGLKKVINALKAAQKRLNFSKFDFNIESRHPWAGTPGSEMVSLFKTPSKKLTISKLNFYVTSSGVPSTPFEVRLYKKRVLNNNPGRKIIDFPIIAAAKTGNEWVCIDISKFQVRIKQNSFYVGMYWLTPPGPEGGKAQCLGARIEGISLENASAKKHGASGCWRFDSSQQWMIQVEFSNGAILDNTIWND